MRLDTYSGRSHSGYGCAIAVGLIVALEPPLKEIGQCAR